jgi:peptidoglycan/LPS O-acetylase OafA/YrhL
MQPASHHRSLSVSEASPTQRRDYNYGVHGFRGFAALMVFVFHIFSTNVIPPLSFVPLWSQIHYLTDCFRYGVELFFMISGYVILSSLSRHATVRQFLLDRCIRIYPAFLPILLLIFFIGPIYGYGLIPAHVNGWKFFERITVPDYIGDFLGNLFFLPEIFPVPLAHWAAWSLSYEWVFYLVAGGSYFLIRRRVSRWALVAALVVGSAVFLNYYPRAAFFIPGVLAFLCDDLIVARRRLFRFPFFALLGLLVAWRATGVNLASPASQLIEWAEDWRILYFMVAIILGGYVIAAVITGQGLLARVLASRLLIFFGTISYSFYLWHPIVIIAIRHLVVPRIVPIVGAYVAAFCFVFVSFAGTLVIAWASWRVLETWLARQVKQQIPASSSASRGG